MNAILQTWCSDQVTYSIDDSGYTASYRDFELSSSFQPIYSISHGQPVGYEGLIRAKNETTNTPCSPLELFEQAETSQDHLTLDRLCRCLHFNNFSRQGIEDKWLFINLDSQSLSSVKPNMGFMSNLFSLSEVRPEHVVIEILESEIKDRAYLKTLITHFREMGCLIAIDDFGAGHSNFDRIWELEPDIVKIDRHLVASAEKSPKVKRILKGIVTLIHEAGSLVVIEGIETEEQANIAIESNADMVQGFYFAKPEKKILPSLTNAKFRELLNNANKTRSEESQRLHAHFKRFEDLFKQAIQDFREHQDHQRCANLMFNEARAVRSYVLDSDGNQLGSTIESPAYHTTLSSQFKPLISSADANWSNKHYHFKAVNNIDKIQISRLYLSMVGRHMCVTVSQAIRVDKKLYVLCCDLYWLDE
jgi:EAL domain-containing protein (putative c-di-GMP-specific phosphodiesterase class I)